MQNSKTESVSRWVQDEERRLHNHETEELSNAHYCYSVNWMLVDNDARENELQ